MSPMQRFERPTAKTRRPEGPTITITRDGMITLSPAARHLLNAANVELLWDPEEQHLGLEPASPSSENAYRVLTTRQTGAGGRFKALDFLKHAGIDHTVARRWPAELDGRVLVADLSEPGTEVTSNRSRVLV